VAIDQELVIEEGNGVVSHLMGPGIQAKPRP